MISVESFARDVDSLKREIKKHKAQTVSSKETRKKLRGLAFKWFKEVHVFLKLQGLIKKDTLKNLDENFDSLLKLTGKRTKTSLYRRSFSSISTMLFEEVIIPLGKIASVPIKNPVETISNLIKTVSDPQEKNYLLECLLCLQWVLTE